MSYDTYSRLAQASRLLSNVGAKVEDMCGREVLIIPIKQLAYLPIDVNDLNPKHKWVLVIEKNGSSWVWDSLTMEG